MTSENPNLPPEVRDLMKAIEDALDVPRPARREDSAEYEYALIRRTGDVRFAAGMVLEGDDPAQATRLLREWIDRYPVTYTVHRPSPWEVLRHGDVIATLPTRDAAKAHAEEQADRRSGDLADELAWHPAADGGEALWLVAAGQATESGWAIRPAAGGEGRRG